MITQVKGKKEKKKGKTKLDFTETRDSEWQWHQLGHMQNCTSLKTDNHASTPPLSFLQAGCPSCHPTNSVKALKGTIITTKYLYNLQCSNIGILHKLWAQLLCKLTTHTLGCPRDAQLP